MARKRRKTLVVCAATHLAGRGLAMACGGLGCLEGLRRRSMRLNTSEDPVTWLFA